MARQSRVSENLKSIAGMALIGLGLLMLSRNLSDACGQLSRLVGVSAEASQTFGVLTAVGLAAAQVCRCYLFDRRELMLGLCKVLISFWPLLLVVAGTVLTAPASRTESKNLQEKIPGLSI